MKELEIAFLGTVTCMSLLMNYVWSTSSLLNISIKIIHLLTAITSAVFLLNKLGVTFVIAK